MNKKQEFDNVLGQIETARTNLSDLISERDELKNVICPKLDCIYNERFGRICSEIAELEIQNHELTVRIEEIQKALNHGKAPDNDSIEEIIRRIYERLNSLLEDTIDGAYFEAEIIEHIDASEKEKAKSLYRKIAKRLHPDVNNDLTEDEKSMWNDAQEAYASGKVFELQKIFDKTKEPENVYNEYSDAAYKINKKTLEDLLNKIQEIKDEIDLIKQRFPYKKKDVIEDKTKSREEYEWLKEEKNRLKRENRRLCDKLAKVN